MAEELEAHQLLFLIHLLCFYMQYVCEEVACMQLDCSAVDLVPRPYSVHVGVGA